MKQSIASEEEIALKNCLDQIGLWECHGGIAMIDSSCRRVSPSWEVPSIPWETAQVCMSQWVSHHVVFLHGICLIFFPGFPHRWTMTRKHKLE